MSSYVPARVTLYVRLNCPCESALSGWVTPQLAVGEPRDAPQVYVPSRRTLSKTSRPSTPKGVASPAMPSATPRPTSCECETDKLAGTQSTWYGEPLMGPHTPAIHSRCEAARVTTHMALYEPSPLSPTCTDSLPPGLSSSSSDALKTSPPAERWLPSRSLAKIGASDTAPAMHLGKSTEMDWSHTVGPGMGFTRNGEPPRLPLFTRTAIR